MTNTLLLVLQGVSNMLAISKKRGVAHEAAYKSIQRLRVEGLLQRHRKKGRIVRYSVNGVKLHTLFLQFIEDEIKRLDKGPQGGRIPEMDEPAKEARAALEQVKVGQTAAQIELLLSYLALQPAGSVLREYFLAFTKDAQKHLDLAWPGPMGGGVRGREAVKIAQFGEALENLRVAYMRACTRAAVKQSQKVKKPL